VRAVFDPNILIAAVLSSSGTPAQLVVRWLAGEFELIVSEALLAELEQALGYAKLRARINAGERADYLALLRHGALLAADPPHVARRSADAGDDYLLALAESEHAVLVSGDEHLLALASDYPVESARAFLDALPTR
jgi:putative PIN family toxin of toxin-antitoxin system